jgi:potassium efflux system protein
MVRIFGAAIAMTAWLCMLGVSAAQFSLPGTGSPEAKSSAEEPAAATQKRAAAGGPITAAAIPARSREAEARFQAARRVTEHPELSGIARELPRFLDEMSELSRITSAATPTTQRRDLDDMRLRWVNLANRLSRWQRAVGRTTDVHEQQTQSIRQLQQTWTVTRESLAQQTDSPRAALSRVGQVLREASSVLTDLAQSSAQLFELHDRLETAQQTVDGNSERLANLRARARELILQAHGRPFWKLFDAASYPEGRLPTLALHTEYDALGLLAFWYTYRHRLPLDALLFGGFLALTLVLGRRARRRGRQLSEGEMDPLRAPFGNALLIALITARFVYPLALSAIHDLLSIATLVTLYAMAPTLVHHVESARPIRRMVAALAVFRVLALLHLETPWYELGLCVVDASIVAAVFGALRIPQSPSQEQPSTPAKSATQVASLQRVTMLFARAALVALPLALLAAIFGYDALLSYLVEGVAGSLYWLLLSVALTRALSGLIHITLGAQRVIALSSVQRHGPLIESRALTFARRLGITVCVLTSLRAFGLLEPTVDWLIHILNASTHVGSWNLSLDDLGSFVLTMYLAAQLARFVSFSLEEDLLPRLSLARGVPATISRLTRYVIIAAGFVFAVGAAGVDLSRLALVASALSVGIGFGLQTIVSNFVSGLVLIFERPVRIGDTIQVADLIGEVRSIGIRSSTLRTAQGAEVIVPNADLVSNRVINWTLSDSSRRVDVPIGVAYGTDPKRVLALLKEAVAQVDGLTRYPGATCLFLGFGDSALLFEVRIWVSRTEDWPIVRSTAVIAMHEALCQAGIELPFPQRDLHVRSIDEGALGALMLKPASAQADASGDAPSGQAG